MKFSLNTAYAGSSWAHRLTGVFLHKQAHIEAGTIVFASWIILPHCFGRAVALFCKVISCHTDASGSWWLTAYCGGSSFRCATLQHFSSGVICWIFCVVCVSGVSLTSHPLLSIGRVWPLVCGLRVQPAPLDCHAPCFCNVTEGKLKLSCWRRVGKFSL